ncbi:MAG: hypothetical protein HZB29_10125 [Nitrospinae bacterium]|nr:hypothetical protein [Nitrospinota bacterium]
MIKRLALILAVASLVIAGDAGRAAASDAGPSNPAEANPADAKPAEAKPSIAAGLPETLSVGPMQEEFFGDQARQTPVTRSMAYETAGFLSATADGYGMIREGENSAQVTFSFGDTVYIDKGEAQGAKAGARYLVFHSSGEDIMHPVSDKPMGRRMSIDGVIEVISANEGYSKAKVVRSYGGVRVGYNIKPYEAIVTPTVDRDRPVKDKTVSGVVLAGKEDRNGFSLKDIVYLDTGSGAGVEVGDIFEITTSQVSAFVPEKDDQKDVVGIRRVIGKALVLSTEKETCAAEIIFSVHIIRPGDAVSYSMAREHEKPVVVKGGGK